MNLSYYMPLSLVGGNPATNGTVSELAAFKLKRNKL